MKCLLFSSIPCKCRTQNKDTRRYYRDRKQSQHYISKRDFYIKCPFFVSINPRRETTIRNQKYNSVSDRSILFKYIIYIHTRDCKQNRMSAIIYIYTFNKSFKVSTISVVHESNRPHEAKSHFSNGHCNQGPIKISHDQTTTTVTTFIHQPSPSLVLYINTLTYLVQPVLLNGAIVSRIAVTGLQLGSRL